MGQSKLLAGVASCFLLAAASPPSRITLTDSDQLQPVKIDPVETTQIRLSIVDAYPPATDAPPPIHTRRDLRSHHLDVVRSIGIES